MKVAELEEGGLYITRPGTIFQTVIIDEKDFRVIVCNIWKSHASIRYPRRGIYERQLMVYLGSTREEWDYYGIKKHHWFLINGLRIRVDANHLKSLEKLDETEI